MGLKIGGIARLIQPVIQGSVIDIRYNKDVNGLEMLVEYSGSDGDVHQRWFDESSLEEVAQ